jgi:signal transduction histidine kinase
MYNLNEGDQTIFYEARIVPMNETKLLTIIRDVSVEKANEKELKESKEQLKIYAQILEEKVKRQTEEVMVTKEQLVVSNLNLEDQVQETQVAEKIALVNKSLSTAIAKNFPNGFIIVFNISSEILLIEGETISQLKLDKVISKGMLVDDISVVSKKQKEKIKEQILETINGKHLSFEIEYEKKHFSVNTTPLLDENNTISTALFVYNDITSQKKTERKVQSALKKEQELNELKSSFISMASHEFRTPLNAIQTSAILIGKKNQPDREEKCAKYVSQIKRNVKNLVVILDEFLSLSKLEEGKIKANRQLFDFIDFSKTLIEEMKITKKLGQNIIFSFPKKKLLLNLDPKLVRQILMNLLSNAIKYSSENTQIYIKITENTQFVFLEIEDQGIGIPKEEQEKLFERFFRASNAQNIEGTGLGLNIVKQYVELMHGVIDFKSRTNKGATFIVKWPKTNKK